MSHFVPRWLQGHVLLAGGGGPSEYARPPAGGLADARAAMRNAVAAADVHTAVRLQA